MLMGTFMHSLDAKGRIILPSRFREDIGESFVVTKGYDTCLSIYPTEDYMRLVERLKALPEGNAATRVVRKHFIGSAHPCEMDKQGRFIVPAALKEFAGLKRDVIIIGDDDKVFIWDTEEHEKFENGEESMSLGKATKELNDMGYYY